MFFEKNRLGVSSKAYFPGFYFVLCLFIGFFVSPNVFATSASLSTSGTVNVDIMPSRDGTTGTSVNTSEVNVVTNCRAGYNLSISGPADRNLYRNGDSTNNTQGQYFTPVDGTSTLKNTTNAWGYSLSANTDSGVFSPLSNTPTLLKTTAQTASQTDIDDDITIYYGVSVSNSLNPGTYEMANNGSIVYQLTMDPSCIDYEVIFNPNGGTGTMANQYPQVGVSTKLDGITFTAPTGASYTDAGNNTISGNADKMWVFWGWNTEIDGSGDWYKNKESVLDLVNAGSTITFYAQWKQATLADMTVSTPISVGKAIGHNLMQDMDPGICWNSNAYTYDTSSPANTPYDASTNPNGYHTIILSDNRGTVRTYRVTKLPDNLCWMTDNLLLGGNSEITLTPDDTDITTNFTLPASDANDFSTADNATNHNKATVLSNMTIPDYTVGGVTFSNKVNTYYSYAAVTADTSTYNKAGETNVTTSICPRSWDLPSGDQYLNLGTIGQINGYNNTSASSTGKNIGMPPYNFLYGGSRKASGTAFNTTTFENGTSEGDYWTASISSGHNAYNARIYSGGINPYIMSHRKFYGLSARCVASQGEVNIVYKKNNIMDPADNVSFLQNNAEINSVQTVTDTVAGFVLTGYGFKGWNTAADGSGIALAAGKSISVIGVKPGDTITLYAQWVPQYAITYINNCYTYSNTCSQSTSDSVAVQTINLDNSGDGSGSLKASNNWTSLSGAGYKIAGWNTAADGTGTDYKPSSVYTVAGVNAGDGITLYARWAPVYNIQYDGNGAINANGMGTTDANGAKTVKQTNIAEGDSVTLLPSNFKRAGYAFIGWSTNQNASPTNGAKIYGPNERIDAPAKPNNAINTLTMYAVWLAAEKDSNNNPIYMQDFSLDDCGSLTAVNVDSATGAITPGSVIALTDKRDNEVYMVAKLADNLCWMTDSLRLEAAGTVGMNINNPTVTNESLAQGYGKSTTFGYFVGLATAETNFAETTTANSIYYSGTQSGTASINIGTTMYPGRRFPRYDNRNTNNNIDEPTYTQSYTNTASPSNIPNINYYLLQNLYSYGNKYTWTAAIANTQFYSSDNSIFAGTSICPSGWKIPYGAGPSYGDSSGYATVASSYYYLNYKTNNNKYISGLELKLEAYPNNFIYNNNSSGIYWSSTASTNVGTANTYNYSNAYLPSSSTSTTYLRPWNEANYVRCVIGGSPGITYDGNGADNMTAMNRQSLNYSATSITLWASNFKRSGYGFAGWNTKPDGTGTNYGPNETITDINTLNGIKTNGLKLYAKWIQSAGDFQSWTCPNDTTMPIGTVTALTDKRDHQTYAVAKLADSNCWMIENLRLEAANTKGQNIFDSSITNESLAQGYATSSMHGDFVGLANSEIASFDYSTTANDIYKSDGSQSHFDPSLNALEDIGTSESPPYRFPRYRNDNTNSTVDIMTGASQNVYSYGNYYTWAASMANTRKYTSPTSTDEDGKTTDNVNTSICPSGWNLPYGNDTGNGATAGGFSYLDTKLGGTGVSQSTQEASNRWRKYPNNFIQSGYTTSTSMKNKGSGGFYWTSTASNAGNSYSLNLDGSSVNPRATGTKYYGYSVRCTKGIGAS